MLAPTWRARRTSGSGEAERETSLAAEERLPETAEDEEVPVLLLEDDVLRPHLEQEPAGRAVGVPHGHVGVVGFREELEPVAPGALDEVDEQQGLVELGEVVVKQDGVGLLALVFEGVLEDRGRERTRRRGLREKSDEASRLRDSFGGLLDVPHVPPHHLAHRVSDVAPGERVVAHVRDAVRRERSGGDREHPLLHGRRHPRIEAVRDDVVERAGIRRVQQVGVEERDVGQAERGDLRAALLDGRARGVQSDERAPRKNVRHGDEVAAVAAAQLEHAAAFGRSSLQAVESCDRREAIRMGLGERRPGIRDGVVGGRLFFRHEAARS